ncbi:hypothetical protein BJ878DRAFT_159969 [Calycina marina]|uniref:Uncharacterized protein n=1 Tax=Calycina marina TaxID=1763456 RepID=A0A9P7YZF6_9HELO|nr:hypothetical protein BJ878DRAFT_159969 [Calycina marina]
MVVGFGLLALLDTTIPTRHWVPILLIVGAVQGTVLLPLSTWVQAASSVEDKVYAASTCTFLRSLGMCVGVSMSGTTIFQILPAHQLRQHQLPIKIAREAESFVAVLKPGQRIFQREWRLYWHTAETSRACSRFSLVWPLSRFLLRYQFKGTV